MSSAKLRVLGRCGAVGTMTRKRQRDGIFVLVGPRLEKSGVGKHGNWPLSLMSDEVERELVPSVQGEEKADDQDAVWKLRYWGWTCSNGGNTLHFPSFPPGPFLPKKLSSNRSKDKDPDQGDRSGDEELRPSRKPLVCACQSYSPSLHDHSLV